MYRFIIILFSFSLLLLGGCQEPSGLDTERLTKVLDSTKTERKLIDPLSIETDLSEEVKGIYEISVGQDSTLAFTFSEVYTIPHKLSDDSKILIDTTNGEIRFFGNINVSSSDISTTVLPGNLPLQRYTRLHSISITLDSVPNNIDNSNNEGLQRKDAQVEFISYTNGTGKKQSHKMTGLLITTIPIGTRLSILNFRGRIPIDPIRYKENTISDFECSLQVIVAW